MSATASVPPPVPPSMPPVEPGVALADGYETTAHLSRGVDLDVYEVWSIERACRCVAKVARPDRLDRQRTRSRLLKEGRLLRRLTHPHLVRAYEVLVEPQPMVILEALTGPTLDDLLADRPRQRLSLTDVAFLGLHLCSALYYLHQHNILHLDLKPTNIIANEHLAKLIDLSVALPPGKGHRGRGTRQYMAPEQVRGGRFSTGTDIWGLGTVLFETVTGQRPFNAHGSGKKYEQIERLAEPVRRYRRVPPALSGLIAACLDPEPDRRPSVSIVIETLNEFIPLGARMGRVPHSAAVS